MTMKNYIFILLITMGVFIGCTEKLDVQPADNEDLNEAIHSAEGLNNIKNGSYAFARTVYGDYFFHFAEFLADTGEINFVGTFEEFSYLTNKELLPTFTYSESSWYAAYRGINGCNLILDHLSVIEDSAQKAELEGHARFIRGLLYFDLTRFFALPYGAGAMSNPAVPLVLKGVTNIDSITYPTKATVGEVFAQVEEDLTKASQLLPANENFFANKYAAFAILSRYYLTIEDYQKAAAMADSVIESGIFELIPNPFNEYNLIYNSKEDIMTWQQTVLDNVGQNNAGMATFYASTNAEGRSDFEINPDFIYATYVADSGIDLRGQIQVGATSVGQLNSMFYEGFAQTANPGAIFSAKWMDYKSNLTFIRLAEMYLTRAEANFHVIQDGGSQVGSNTPAADIAVIRNRAGILFKGTPSVTLADIQYERYKELIFEGHRLHDYKRWHRSVGDIPFDSDQLIIPIPKRETDTNPNL
jgi:starch-binding outer membrane protein, SusD/RagB family